MERTAGKRVFTRWLLAGGGVVLLLALAMSVVLSRPQGVTCDLKFEFVRFDTAADGEVDYAVLKVRNESSRKWVLLSAREMLSLKSEESPMFQALGRFTTNLSTGKSGRVSRSYIGGGAVHGLNTNTV